MDAPHYFYGKSPVCAAGNARQLVVTALNRADAAAVAQMKRQAEQQRSNPGWRPPSGRSAGNSCAAASAGSRSAPHVEKRSSKVTGF